MTAGCHQGWPPTAEAADRYQAELNPQDKAERDKVILSAFAYPDSRQIDGMRGANTSTCKVTVIKKSTRPKIDVDYDFWQVDISSPIVGKTMNCGNISSVTGPYAIDAGLFNALPDYAENCRKMIDAHMDTGSICIMVSSNTFVKQLGFDMKSVIHPNQIPIIYEV